MSGKKSAVASKWRASRYTELTLPSGEVVEVRIPSLDVFIKYGRLPQELVSKVVSLDISKDTNAEKVAEDFLSVLSRDEFAAFMLFAREIVRATLVSPRIVVRDEGDDTPLEDDEIAPEDIPETDFWAIFSWATAKERTVKTAGGEVSAAALQSFRPDERISTTGENGG